MMSRDEFQKTVRQMQNDGVPLTMANLLVRTELPRATIQDYLDDMQRDVKHDSRSKDASDESDREEASEGGSLVDRAKALKKEVVGEIVRSQLGLGSDSTRARRPKRGVRIGGVLGLVAPPVGLAYSAPWSDTILGTIAYLALAWLALKIPFVGIPYLLIPLHLLGGAAGAASAWRFNRKGKRTHLLPSGKSED